LACLLIHRLVCLLVSKLVCLLVVKLVCLLVHRLARLLGLSLIPHSGGSLGIADLGAEKAAKQHEQTECIEKTAYRGPLGPRLRNPTSTKQHVAHFLTFLRVDYAQPWRVAANYFLLLSELFVVTRLSLLENREKRF
jgi:hypothetical protein